MGRGGRVGVLGAAWERPVFHLFLLFFLFFWLDVVPVVCVHIFPLTLLNVCLDTHLPDESRDKTARGNALVSKRCDGRCAVLNMT